MVYLLLLYCYRLGIHLLRSSHRNSSCRHLSPGTALLSSYIMDTNGHKARTSHSVVVCSLTSPACVLLSWCWWLEVRGRKERAGGGARASTATTPPSQTMSGILSRAPDPLFRLSSGFLLRPLLRQSSGCLQFVFRLSSGKDSLQQAVLLSSGCH